MHSSFPKPIKPRTNWHRFGRLALIASGLAVTSEPKLAAAEAAETNAAESRPPLYSFTLTHAGSPESYDEAMAVACLQGIINRKSPEVYVLSRKNNRPQYW